MSVKEFRGVPCVLVPVQALNQAIQAVRHIEAAMPHEQASATLREIAETFDAWLKANEVEA